MTIVSMSFMQPWLPRDGSRPRRSCKDRVQRGDSVCRRNGAGIGPFDTKGVLAVAALAIHPVIAGAADKHVITVATMDSFVTAERVDDVIAGSADRNAHRVPFAEHHLLKRNSERQEDVVAQL